ncbi:hypothetical protein BV898_05655 [Hypsibius exemplaris]|uniref:Pro-corazonin n=1 Tax=Hypsibius exemplaris TaxID=2072580 RepID=A0A1W0WYU3_HYPEX|nr:hypothetical protein BV898_05655 [Hypsibius exemplaris]
MASVLQASLLLTILFTSSASPAHAQKFQYSKGWMPGGKRGDLPPFPASNQESPGNHPQLIGPIDGVRRWGALEEPALGGDGSQDDYEEHAQIPFNPPPVFFRPRPTRGLLLLKRNNELINDDGDDYSTTNQQQVKMFRPLSKMPSEGWYFLYGFFPAPFFRSSITATSAIPNGNYFPLLQGTGRGFHRTA